MAQIIDRTTGYKQQKPQRFSCFLGCFGGSSGGSPENKHSLEEGETIGMKKTRTVWFSSSKLKKKSSPRKTVPVDGSTEEKVHPKKASIFHIKSSKKPHKDQIPGPVTGKTVHKKPNKTKYDNVQEIILENSKSITHLDSMEKATCRKGLSAISKCKSQNSNSTPTTPEDKFEVSRGKVALAHSVSMPPPRRKKTGNIGGGDSKVNIEEKTSQRKTDGSRFDQFVGISIIMVTLILMAFCGKICAILCTSAWFYFYPLVRGKNEPKLVGQESGPKSGNRLLDFNSQEYKKKVVLEGFLERNHRIH